MNKRKNSFKITSVIIIITMLISSLFTMSAGAADTITINGEVYTVEISSWSYPGYQTETRSTDFTPEELVEFYEALSDIDYENYKIFIKEDYTIKRVFLKHGYSIDFITLNTKIESSARMRAGISVGKARVSVNDTNGQEVTWAEMAVNFSWTGTSVSILSRNIIADPNPPGGGAWTNLSTQDGGNSSVRTVRGLATFSAPGITAITYNMWVSGDSDGNTW